MRFWLSAFVILFVAVELFDWIMQVGSWQASGVWLVLGGMGLAAVSNWDSGSSQRIGKGEVGIKEAQKPTENDMQTLDEGKGEAIGQDGSDALDRSDDSISFKVRPLKR